MDGETRKLGNCYEGDLISLHPISLETWFFIIMYSTDRYPKYFLLTINRLH
ncbi:hypothetical protein C943_03623 [Mariniradius saccharolyticus AK6]|uniref:Uncharacterized protein n=1 Tax=Mariniradius saccharolyticus AK6 TaxID=1239962 RepID=M7XHW8_9BACT|nr:hypothetical protein C943_03623 [Mariniradius saccharolyticus AK6]